MNVSDGRGKVDDDGIVGATAGWGKRDEFISSGSNKFVADWISLEVIWKGVSGVCGTVEVDPDTRAEGAGDRCAAEGATSCEVPAKAKSLI